MATPGVEDGAERGTGSGIHRIELGGNRARLTLLPERPGEEVDPALIEALRPTGYVLPYGDTMQLDRAMEDAAEDPYPFPSSLVRAAYGADLPVYLTGGRTPEALRDLDPQQIRTVSLIPDFLALGAFGLAVGHFVIPPKPQNQTRRDILKASALATAGAALYMAFGPHDAAGPKYDEVEARLAQYSEEEQSTLVRWYKMLRGFSNLILARKMHEIARVQGGGEGENLIVLVPQNNDGLRAALSMSTEQRDSLIVDFIEQAINPLYDAGVLNIDDYNMLLGEMGAYIEAHAAQDAPTPMWGGEVRPVLSFAEPSE